MNRKEPERTGKNRKRSGRIGKDRRADFTLTSDGRWVPVFALGEIGEILAANDNRLHEDLVAERKRREPRDPSTR